MPPGVRASLSYASRPGPLRRPYPPPGKSLPAFRKSVSGPPESGDSGQIPPRSAENRHPGRPPPPRTASAHAAAMGRGRCSVDASSQKRNGVTCKE